MARDVKHRVTKLTARQVELLRLICEGMTEKAVASELGISLKTVEAHCATINRKMGTRNRAMLGAEAVRQGYV